MHDVNTFLEESTRALSRQCRKAAHDIRRSYSIQEVLELSRAEIPSAVRFAVAKHHDYKMLELMSRRRVEHLIKRHLDLIRQRIDARQDRELTDNYAGLFDEVNRLVITYKTRQWDAAKHAYPDLYHDAIRESELIRHEAHLLDASSFSSTTLAQQTSARSM